MNFIKTFWAALLAFVVANIVLFVLGMMILAGIIAAVGSGDKVVVRKGSLLKLDLADVVTEAPKSSPFDGFDLMTFKNTPSNALYDVVTAIDAAAMDDNIAGLFMTKPHAVAMDGAKAEEIRAALLRFKESGKPIAAYGDSHYSKLGYLIASTADHIFLHPDGMVDWSGMATMSPFLTGFFKKAGIEPVIIRHGKFKAAVEPFMLDKMSPENRLQVKTYIDAIWGTLVGEVSSARGLDSTMLSTYPDELDNLLFAEKAVEHNLVDSLFHFDQWQAYLMDMAGVDDQKDLRIVTMGNYISAVKNAVSHAGDKVAVIYAEGDIVHGDGEKGQIGSYTLTDLIADARRDDDVKAVVLRINSGGGSAHASEIMHRELQLLRAEKPLIVSMGSVAASGGYYMAAPADVILAQKTTITGSIGVFGLMFYLGDAFRSHLGITFDGYKTNESADMSMLRRLSEGERAAIQKSVESTYSQFTDRVAEGRNMTPEAVDAIGGGRVWAGTNALEIGLVDGFGGLTDAIALAADRAGIADNFSVRHMIPADETLAMLMSFNAKVRESALRSELGAFYKEYNMVKTMIEQNRGVQARMPYGMEIAW